MDFYKMTFETWNSVAELYQERFMDVELYNDTYNSFCDLIPKQGASILEIACGPGNITRYLISKRPDFDILATDVAPNMLKLAQANNPSAKFQVIDCREITKINQTFDGIMCGFCMPYLSKEDCLNLIQDCSSLLNPGGILYMSTMEDDYSKSGFKTGSDGKTKMYMYFHEESYITDFLKQSNFEIVELVRKNCPNPDGTFAIDMIFIARKS